MIPENVAPNKHHNEGEVNMKFSLNFLAFAPLSLSRTISQFSPSQAIAMRSPKCPQKPASLLPNMPASVTTFLILSNLVFLSSFLVSAQSEDYHYQNCSSPFKCGSLQKNLSYPFWSDARPNYCGHPGFKLACPGDGGNGSVTIEVGSQTLDVVSINMATKSMYVFWPGFSSDPCPLNPPNITFDRAIFNYTTDVKNIAFSYDCSTSQAYEGRTRYTCPKSSFFSGKTAYYVDSSAVTHAKVESCKVNVLVPMLGAAVEMMGSSSSSVLDGLMKGFEVGWVGLEGTGSCSSCSASNGACGYDWSSKEPTCFCREGANAGGCSGSNSSSRFSSDPDASSYTPDATSPPPQPSGKLNVKEKIGIGIGAGLVAAGIVASAAFIFYRRRHKKTHEVFANAIPLPRNAPLDPSALSNLENGDSFLGVDLFSYDELKRVTDYFSPSKELGEGGFGTVYYGKLGDGREVAIKRMFENNSKRVQQFMNEIEILTHLRHKNLVTLYGCTSRHSLELLLVYEYVPNGTVADHLHGRKARLAPNTEFSPLPWRTRLSIAEETASALVYLHATDIIHRDVKTNNILLDNHCSVKVADFGLSRLFPLDLTHVSTAPQGTPGYVDPEYHQCYQLTEKSDVYSFGVVLIELISTMPAVDITRHRHEINLSNLAINKIQNDALHELVDPTLGYDTDAKVKEEVTMVAELAFQCLQHDRDMRPTMEQVLEVLTRIRESDNHDDMMINKNYMGMLKAYKAEVVDILAEEALRLKSDLSPVSSAEGSKRKNDIDNATTSHSC